MRSRQGFTLIELLVVVSIIGLLSSIVLASLSVAKKKANQVVVKEEMLQFRDLLEASYDPSLRPDGQSYGYSGLFTYSKVPNGYDGSEHTFLGSMQDCDSSYGTGSFAQAWNPTVASEANQLCKKIITAVLSVPRSDMDGEILLIGYGYGDTYDSTLGWTTPGNKYSIMVYNGNEWTKPPGVDIIWDGLWCVSGNAGPNFEPFSTADMYSHTGCLYDPNR